MPVLCHICARHDPGSSNGRTADSESASRGSNPRPGAISATQLSSLRIMLCSLCGSEDQNYVVAAIFQRQHLAIHLVALHLLHLVEVGDFLAHNQANTGPLRNACEMQMKLMA